MPRESDEFVDARSDAAAHSLHRLLLEGKLMMGDDGKPITSGMIQGFAMVVRVLDEKGEDYIGLVFGPTDTISANLGDARYMMNVMDQIAMDSYFGEEED